MSNNGLAVKASFVYFASDKAIIMTISKSRLKRKVRDRKQEKRFFITLGIITLVLIVILFIAYG